MAEPTYEELKAKLAELEKQGPRRTGSLEFRVGEKGGVSVYGLGRFPVTCREYAEFLKQCNPRTAADRLPRSWHKRDVLGLVSRKPLGPISTVKPP